MKPRGVTNLGAQVGGCAPDTQPRWAPQRRDKASRGGRCHGGSQNNRSDRHERTGKAWTTIHNLNLINIQNSPENARPFQINTEFLKIDHKRSHNGSLNKFLKTAIFTDQNVINKCEK